MLQGYWAVNETDWRCQGLNPLEVVGFGALGRPFIPNLHLNQCYVPQVS